jgi:hypothetical protein
MLITDEHDLPGRARLSGSRSAMAPECVGRQRAGGIKAAVTYRGVALVGTNAPPLRWGDSSNKASK